LTKQVATFPTIEIGEINKSVVDISIQLLGVECGERVVLTAAVSELAGVADMYDCEKGM
jgi:hypothetical protein